MTDAATWFFIGAMLLGLLLVVLGGRRGKLSSHRVEAAAAPPEGLGLALPRFGNRQSAGVIGVIFFFGR